jgi:molybdenum cofactor cytidylyltransferase
MGTLKQLLPFGERTVLAHIVSTLENCPVDEILVITGHERAAIEEALSSSSAKTIFNPNYATGEMLSSIQAGLAAASDSAVAALIFLGDQPALDQTVVEQIVVAHRNGPGSIVIPSYQMRRGHPILIAREHWAAILALDSSESLRDFLRRVNPSTIQHINVPTTSILGDMDTPADYRRELANHLNRAGQ